MVEVSPKNSTDLGLGHSPKHIGTMFRGDTSMVLKIFE